LAENLGGTHPFVTELLAGKSPAARATELVAGTKLADPAVRRQIAADGLKSIEASGDTMIRFAQLVDADARKLRKRYEDQVEEVERQANAKIARVRFELLGTGIAPDATFTLRLAFGTVRGYEVDGEKLPYFTTFVGAFERAAQQQHREPFELPPR